MKEKADYLPRLLPNPVWMEWLYQATEFNTSPWRFLFVKALRCEVSVFTSFHFLKSARLYFLMIRDCHPAKQYITADAIKLTLHEYMYIGTPMYFNTEIHLNTSVVKRILDGYILHLQLATNREWSSYSLYFLPSFSFSIFKPAVLWSWW